MKLGRPIHATVVAYLALFVAMGGSAYAVKQLPKNSVGSPQIKKNAVKTGDIARNAVKVGKLAKEAVKAGKLAKNAVPTNRLRNNAVTGDKVNEATLGIVPAANSANTANTANSLGPPEGWHEIGAPGEPGFQDGWHNLAPEPEWEWDSVAFYKDQGGVVHLKGFAEGPGSGPIFLLPPGYRPRNGTLKVFPMSCSGTTGFCFTNHVSNGTLVGPDTLPGLDGAVVAPANGKSVSLDGITFRAES